MKIEFIKHITHDNKIIYYTELNGIYVPESNSDDLEKATKMYDMIVASNSKNGIKEVLKTIQF